MNQVAINEFADLNDFSGRVLARTFVTQVRRPSRLHNPHVMATLKISTVITRTGKKKPTYELLYLQPLTTAPLAPREQK